jgi:hypothetical protein
MGTCRRCGMNTVIAQKDIAACLKLLRERAMVGTKAKPTVKELNDIMARLERAERALGRLAEVRA